MEELLRQVRKAVENDLYYLALHVTLAIPDICGALSSQNGETNKAKYVDWFAKNLSGKYKMLDGETCYYYRCSVLHQGRSQHRKSRFHRILFIEPSEHLLNLPNSHAELRSIM